MSILISFITNKNIIMKKVTLWHLSKKHNISIDQLRTLFVSEWLMKKWARKVVKKPAKKLIASYLSASDVATSSLRWWFTKEMRWYLALWALALWAIFWFMNGTVWEWFVYYDQSASDIVIQDDAQEVDHGVAEEEFLLPKTWADLSEL